MSENYVNEFGEAQLPGKITNKNKARAYSKQDNSTAEANNYVDKNHDPHNYTTRFPDGSQITHAWGKNPRATFQHSSGTQIHIYPDGTLHIIGAGNHNEYHKGGSTTTVDGHVDSKGGGHTRNNYAGGFYQDVAGDHASHVAGSSAHHVAGDHNVNVSGNHTIRGNKRLVMGTQDDGGKMAMSIDMNSGRIQIKGKGDVELSSTEGNLKIKGKSISLHGDSIALNGGQTISLSSGGSINQAASEYKTAPAPTTMTSYSAEKGVHDDIASAKNSFNYNNTLDT
jgi:hypothetical protein